MSDSEEEGSSGHVEDPFGVNEEEEEEERVNAEGDMNDDHDGNGDEDDGVEEEEEEEEAMILEIGKKIAQDEKTRFRLDLEFVECLAQPYYLHCMPAHSFPPFIHSSSKQSGTPSAHILALLILENCSTTCISGNVDG
jgi:hypothetical protein